MTNYSRAGGGRMGPALALALTVLLWSSPTSAALLVDATVVDQGGGVFDWSFVVTNTGLVDVSLVTLTDGPPFDPLIGPSLSAPPGFLALYDPGFGFVDFVEGTQPFPAGGPSIGHFTFSSLAGPASGAFRSFQALSVVGDLFEGDVTVTPIAAPEPATLALMAMGGLGALRAGRRRSRR